MIINNVVGKHNEIINIALIVTEAYNNINNTPYGII
jgi:hypothetical protein